MRKSLIAGNWKLNGSLDSISSLLSEIKERAVTISSTELAVCPPFIYIDHVCKQLAGSSVKVGTQDCSDKNHGAYTGEVAASMINEFDCKYVIVGHSERRHIYGESNEIVAQKFGQVKKHKLIPIFCVGETLQEREDGHTEVLIAHQIDAVLNLLGVEGFKEAVIAYEPVWAIGTGQTATPEQAQKVHDFIRCKIDALDKEIAANMRILYGGSMKPENAKELLQKSDIDGGLIGGASLKAADFIEIAAAVK